MEGATISQTAHTPVQGDKRPFDIDAVMDGVREVVKPYPKAVLHELAELGHTSLFEQVVACIISIRTLEEVTMPASKRLFEAARTPAEMLALTPEQIEQFIRPATFYERKARQILTIAQQALAVYDGTLPCDDEVVRGFGGVGPKCANLALGIACMQRGLPVRSTRGVGAAGGSAADDGQAQVRLISVDIHVHRVTNRWGYVSTRTPEQSMVALEKVLPPKYDVEINALLVPFGKYHCTRKVPKCSICPVLEYCQQVGVTSHR